MRRKVGLYVMGYKMKHSRETIAKATAKGQGMKMDKMPAGKGMMGKKDCPKISKIG